MAKKIDRRKRRQVQAYKPGERLGCRLVLAYRGFYPTRFNPKLVGGWQHVYLVQCVECGHEEEREQVEIRGMKNPNWCTSCPPEVKRKHKRKPRDPYANIPPPEIYSRPVTPEALWHLWIHVHVLRARPRGSVPFESRFDSERSPRRKRKDEAIEKRVHATTRNRRRRAASPEGRGVARA